MSPPTVLVIATLALETGAPATSAAADAARASLGPNVEVRVEANATLAEAPKPPTLEGFVMLRWDSPEHRRARLLCYLPEERRWVDREVAFRPEDPELERGRALGFVIASIYVDVRAEKEQKSTAPIPALEPDRHTHDYAVGAAAALTFPGDATAFGAWLGVERRLGAPLSLGLFAEARFGSIPAAQATTRFLGAGATGRIQLLRLAADFELAARLSLAVADVSATHLSGDDPGPDLEHRLLPGGDLTVEASYWLTPHSTLWLAGGASVVAGSTEVIVHGETEATLPAIAGLARLGLRTEF